MQVDRRCGVVWCGVIPLVSDSPCHTGGNSGRIVVHVGLTAREPFPSFRNDNARFIPLTPL